MEPQLSERSNQLRRRQRVLPAPGIYRRMDFDIVPTTKYAQELVTALGDIYQLEQRSDEQRVTFEDTDTEDVPCLFDGEFQFLCIAKARNPASNTIQNSESATLRSSDHEDQGSNDY